MALAVPGKDVGNALLNVVLKRFDTFTLLSQDWWCHDVIMMCVLCCVAVSRWFLVRTSPHGWTLLDWSSPLCPCASFPFTLDLLCVFVWAGLCIASGVWTPDLLLSNPVFLSLRSRTGSSFMTVSWVWSAVLFWVQSRSGSAIPFSCWISQRVISRIQRCTAVTCWRWHTPSGITLASDNSHSYPSKKPLSHPRFFLYKYADTVYILVISFISDEQMSCVLAWECTAVCFWPYVSH